MSDVSVVVPSHERPGRLRTLLDALAGQTLAPARWDVVVVHDDAGDATDAMLAGHPLAHRGALRHVRLPAGTGSPARQRNVGWRLARAPRIAFTDDDCRPDATWLERLLAAAEATGAELVQGATRPDPRDAHALASPWTRTLHVDPPTPEAPTCNLLYAREVLERHGGFDERFPGPAGEDTDLAQRALAGGARLAAAPDAVVFHAVEAYSLSGYLRLAAKWGHLPLVVARHPALRDRVALRYFWKERHWQLLLAAGGLALAPRVRPAALAAGPYVRALLTVHGRDPREVLRAAAEAPGRAAADAVEVATLARGSVRYRTLLL